MNKFIVTAISSLALTAGLQRLAAQNYPSRPVRALHR